MLTLSFPTDTVKISRTSSGPKTRIMMPPYLHDILKGWMGEGYVMCLGNWNFFQRERRQCYCADYFEEPGYFCNF